MSPGGRTAWIALAACVLLSACRAERLGRELLAAIDASETGRARSLIERGAALDVAGRAGRHALTLAACEGRADIVDAILTELAGLTPAARTAYLDHASRGGPRTALECAAAEGHVAIASALIGAGARIGGPGHPLYRTPLIWAAQNGRLDTVELLLASGADVDEGISDINDLTALMAAARTGQVEVVRALVARGANLEGYDHDGTALGKAARYTAPAPRLYGRPRGGGPVSEDDYVEIARILVEAGANLEAEGFRDSALYRSVSAGNRKLTRLLLEAGAHPDGGPESYRGGRPLLAAASRGDLAAVRLLIAAGADVGSSGEWSTPLMSAAASSRVEVMRALIESGADVNQSLPRWPGTALAAAARIGHLEAVRELLARGATVGPHDLQQLEVTGDPRIIQLLRDAPS